MPEPFQVTTWTHADTIEYLRLNPLPADFIWRDRDGAAATVRPTYNIGNYGKWLHDTPYFPGLFELIHDLLFQAGKRLPDIATLTAELERIRKHRDGQLRLF